MEKIDEEKITKLIRDGFDLDIISDGLKVPYTEVLRINNQISDKYVLKQKITDPSQKTNTSREPKEKANISTYSSSRMSKMDMLRKKYFALYNSEDKKRIHMRPLTQGEYDDIKSKLDDLRVLYGELFRQRDAQQNSKLMQINKLANEVFSVQLPIDLALKGLLDFNEKVDMTRIHGHGKTNTMVMLSKQIPKRYSESLQFYMQDITSLEELDELSKRIDGILENYVRENNPPKDGETDREEVAREGKIKNDLNYMKRKHLIILKSGFFTKREKIKRERRETDILENVPQNIKSIIMMITGKMAYDDAEMVRLLDEQVKLNLQKKSEESQIHPKPVLTGNIMPTHESERVQILFKISRLLEEEELVDPIYSFEKLEKLKGGNSSSAAFETIFANLIKNKRFDEARTFLEKYVSTSEEPTVRKGRRAKLDVIRNAEIADFIMRGILAKPKSYTEDNNYYRTIQNGLRKANISPHSIVLGKSKDGQRNISLSDIMDNERELED